MVNGAAEYTSAMYGLLGAVQRGDLSLSEIQYNPLTEDDNVGRVLAETGHEPLIQLILHKTCDFRVFTEIVDGYIQAGKFREAVDIMRQHPEINLSIEVRKFMDTLLAEEVNDQLIIDFAEYLEMEGKAMEHARVSSSYPWMGRVLIEKVWKAGRDELAATLIRRFMTEEEWPFFELIDRLRQGEAVDPQEVTDVFEAYCPYDAEWKKKAGMWDNGRERVEIASFFIQRLEDDGMDVSLGVVRATLEAYVIRKQSRQFDSLSSLCDMERSVLQGLLAENDFGEAKAFVETINRHAGDWEVMSAQLAYGVEHRDEENHREGLEDFVALQQDWLEIFERKGERLKWEDRLRCSRRRSELLAEQAIFELRHGTEEAAAAYIAQMIEVVDQMGIPGNADCPGPHRGRLRKEKLKQKRLLRERFQEVGLLDRLPRRDRWSDSMQVTLAEKRDANRKNRQARNEEQEERVDAILEEELDRFESRDERYLKAVRVALKQRMPDRAIRLLKKQMGGGYANKPELATARVILEAVPDRFGELVQLLTAKGYFRKDHFAEWSRRDHDELARFYVLGQRLGVVGNVEWEALVDRWDDARRIPDNVRAMPHHGITAMVEGLLEIGDWQGARRYYEKARATKMLRPTMVICEAAFSRHAISYLEEGTSGVEAAFRSGELPEDADVETQLQYWNSQTEWALATQSEEDYGTAYEALVGFLDDPKQLREWTRLLAIGSLRTHHQKKDVLMEAYELHKDCPEARWRIVIAMIDHDIPGAEAMPEVKSKATPHHVAVLFFKKLIAKGVLHEHTTEYLTKEDLPYLRRMLSEHQNQFNTTMVTIERDLEKQGRTRLETKEWRNILRLLRSVGTVTPGIYAEAKAVKFHPRALREIEARIARFKEGLFSNTPVDEEMSQELLAELIELAFQPGNNMELDTIESYCGKVSDCTHHLAGYHFPDKGYPLDLFTSRTMHLRRGARLETPRELWKPKRIEDVSEPVDGYDRLVQVVSGQFLVRKLCKVGRLKPSDLELTDVLDLFEEDAFLKGTLDEWSTTAFVGNESYRVLRQLQEALGVYLEDNLEGAVYDYLKRHRVNTSEMVKSFVKSVKKPGRRQAIKHQLGVVIDPAEKRRKVAAKVISQAILQKFKPLQEVRRSIGQDVKQFVADDGEEVVSADVRLRAVISKNIPSFFAKASAGICTDRNVGLFEREDHFHINLIDQDSERCVGNVQAYIIQHEGRPYLLLRGLNPSTGLLKQVDVESLCEAIIAVGQRFVNENGLGGLMLSEQGGFLALSNRPEVTTYIEKAYKGKVVPIQPFDITDGRVIKQAYLVEERPPHLSAEELRPGRTPVTGHPESMVA